MHCVESVPVKHWETKMNSDLVERLRADELPGDSQNKREARMELGKILDEAADRIEKLELRVSSLEDRIKSVMSYIHLNRGRGRSSDILDGAYDELRRGIK